MESSVKYIAGIGFSAGGLEALTLLFDHTPQDGVSYVIIQHLPTDYRSRLGEILARHSKLKILEAEDNLWVDTNKVYLMPDRKNIRIENGYLKLSESEGMQPNHAIDIFLESLARDQGNKSIGILLSGTGQDGTKGIIAIKQVEGMVMVQRPETAKYDGMLRSAIESGYVDHVLRPESMPSQIMEYVRQLQLIQGMRNSDESLLVQILEMIQAKTPFDFSDYKRPTIIRRISKRMGIHHIHSLQDYIYFLSDHPNEIELLSNEFLINVTKFFRDEEAYEIIQQEIIPNIIQSRLSGETLKIWSIGCATGEEAYSLAILVREFINLTGREIDVKIFATDIDAEAIAFASRGAYPETIRDSVSSQRLAAFFHFEGGKYHISQEIRKMIIFAQHDIIKQPPYGKIDLISCRNLLIYLNPLLQKKIFSAIHFCLNVNGYLFLGSSENLGDFKKFFIETDKKWKIYKNIHAAKSIGGLYSTNGMEIKHHALPLPVLKPYKSTPAHSYADIIIQGLLRHTKQAGVCIDMDYKILQPFGDLRRYLLPEMFNLNLLEIVPQQLSIAIGSALRDAAKFHTDINLHNITYKDEEINRSVNICVIPFLHSHNSFIVLFSETIERISSDHNIEVFEINEHTHRYLTGLEKELKETKEHLAEAYQALETSNENAQTYHEELVSGNEEMQSVNEELQSINEELQTVNTEYVSKIKELAELNDDLNNYFRSTVNGQIYVDRNLIIRKFNAAATKQVNLIEGDIGRSLTNISTNIRIENMIDDIIRVIMEAIVSEKQVQTKEGKWYQMVIMPYLRNQKSKADGAIITFNDITELKKAQEAIVEINQEALQVKNLELTKINDDLDSFIYVASHDLKAPVANLEGLLASYYDACLEHGNTDSIVDMMATCVSRLRDTIQELSEISKIQKSLEEDTEKIELNQLFTEVLLGIQDIIDHNNAIIEIHLKHEMHVHFSRRNLRSIIYNLISNSIKYRSNQQPHIHVYISEAQEYIVIEFKDNGLGIQAAHLPKIFDMFKRFHTHVEGTGVGLYIVKRMLDNAEGKIEVQSTPGEGTAIQVFIKKHLVK